MARVEVVSTNLHDVLKVFCTLEAMRGDRRIELRWRQKGDGDTRWHDLSRERGVFGEGLFPWQADYRVVKVPGPHIKVVSG